MAKLPNILILQFNILGNFAIIIFWSCNLILFTETNRNSFEGSFDKILFFKNALYQGWIELLRGDWPSRLRCNQDWKVSDSNLTRCSARLSETTSLKVSLWPLGRIWKYIAINIGWVRLPLCYWPKIGHRAAK